MVKLSSRYFGPEAWVRKTRKPPNIHAKRVRINAIHRPAISKQLGPSRLRICPVYLPIICIPYSPREASRVGHPVHRYSWWISHRKLRRIEVSHFRYYCIKRVCLPSPLASSNMFYTDADHWFSERVETKSYLLDKFAFFDYRV